MFRFFLNRKWFLWSWLGSIIILGSLWVQVKIDVKINEWFGQFYDMIQKALATPNAITSIFLYAASFACISYSIPTKRSIQPKPIKNAVPPTVQSNAPVISPYCQSPKKNIGIPNDNPNSIGIN